MIREDRALWFPQVSGTCLADRTTKDTVDLTAGKVSVIAILNSRISEVRTSIKCKDEISFRFGSS
jgi:ATPase complex subunit ATP10